MKNGRLSLALQAGGAAVCIHSWLPLYTPAPAPRRPPDNTGPRTDMTPCPLTAGWRSREISPRWGKWMSIDSAVPASSARTLLEVSLSNMTPVSPVQLFFTVENSDGSSVLATRGPADRVGPAIAPRNLPRPLAGATYRIIVRDASNTHADPHNGYELVASRLTDPDPGEPDNTPAQARQLALSSMRSQASGVIADRGDIELMPVHRA